MTTKPGNLITDAQAELHKEVRAALDKFTETTGILCVDLSWATVTANDAMGHVEAAQYWDFRTSLQSGIL